MSVLNPVMVNQVMSQLSAGDARRVRELLGAYKSEIGRYNNLKLALFVRKQNAKDLLDWLSGCVKGDEDIELILTWSPPSSPRVSATPATPRVGSNSIAEGVVNAIQMVLDMPFVPLDGLVSFVIGKILPGDETMKTIFKGLVYALLVLLVLVVGRLFGVFFWASIAVICFGEWVALKNTEQHQNARIIFGFGFPIVLLVVFLAAEAFLGGTPSRATGPTVTNGLNPRGAGIGEQVEDPEPWKAHQITKANWDAVRTAIGFQEAVPNLPESDEFKEIGFPISDVWVGEILRSCKDDLAQTLTALAAHKRGCR